MSGITQVEEIYVEETPIEECFHLASEVVSSGFSAVFSDSAHLAMIAAVHQSMMDNGILPALDIFDSSVAPEESASGSPPEAGPANWENLPTVDAPPAPGQFDSAIIEPQIVMVKSSQTQVFRIDLARRCSQTR